MINKAHIGIGIKGLEGYEAATASDYSIGEFKILSILNKGVVIICCNVIVIFY